MIIVIGKKKSIFKVRGIGVYRQKKACFHLLNRVIKVDLIGRMRHKQRLEEGGKSTKQLSVQDYYMQKGHLTKGPIRFFLDSLKNSSEANVTGIMATAEGEMISWLGRGSM